eukprot:CAMPEP_0198612486 /NCGR_PEP_ID=MMETSP1462-20131121/157920_1 /TAXON_ID=1333877 /ORGANISM="Brandtodinium nutriculum, Strain RCC3387" /LENGTH=348 /DNA_ID=CAMNT_0044344287 /DNA_START=53 /DNA_END=1097 /DNA_ORIENTATION=-
MAIVSGLMSNRMKQAFLKELLGFVPVVGNVVKGSVAFFMTEGIGKIAAKSLRCGDSEELMAQAANTASSGASGAAGQLQQKGDGTASSSSTSCPIISAAGAAASADVDAQVAKRVHFASSLAALTDGGLAQLPWVGPMVVPSIQAAMVCNIGLLYGCHLDRSNALAIVTGLMSNHMKKAFLKELLGIVPLVGNVVKGSVTFLMTEGIGNLAARSLRCGDSAELMAQVSAGAGAGGAGGALQQRGEGTARQLFHFVSDYLGNMEMSSLNATEAWQRVRLLFSAKGQEELLAKVQEASTAEDLAELARRHSWNREVVLAALQALQARFPGAAGCACADFVAERFWAGRSS